MLMTTVLLKTVVILKQLVIVVLLLFVVTAASKGAKTYKGFNWFDVLNFSMKLTSQKLFFVHLN